MEWQPIETLPMGEHVLLWFPKGERGVGGMECATVFVEDDGFGKIWYFWTEGGPNSGSDWSAPEAPTRWMRLPPPPTI